MMIKLFETGVILSAATLTAASTQVADPALAVQVLAGVMTLQAICLWLKR